MNRRDFLKAAAGFILAATGSSALMRQLKAAPSTDPIAVWENEAWFVGNNDASIGADEATILLTPILPHGGAVWDLRANLYGRSTDDGFTRISLARSPSERIFMVNLHNASSYRYVPCPGDEPVICPAQSLRILASSSGGPVTGDFFLIGGKKLPT